MYDDLFTADKRENDKLVRKIAYMKTVDDLLMEATMEAEFGIEAGSTF